MLLADFGVSAVLSIIAIVSSIAMAIIAHNQQPSEAEEGSALGLKQNRADPGDPSPWVSGAPRWKPPLLAREVLLVDQTTGNGVLNTFNGTNLRPRNTLIFDTGIGPMDGGDLNVWLDEQAAYEVVNEVTNPAARRLLPVDGTSRKQFYFPKLSVDKEGVEFFLDGTLYGVSRGTDLSKYGRTERTFNAGIRTYLVDGKTKTTFEPDDTWDPDNTEFRIKLERWNVGLFYSYATGETKFVDATVGDGVRLQSVVTGTTGVFFYKQATREDLYVVDEDVEEQKKVGSIAGVDQWKRVWRVKEVRVTTQKVNVELFDVETEKFNLTSKAIFTNSVPAGKTEANYRSQPFGEEANLKVDMSLGTLDQTPFQTTLLGGSAQTHLTSKPITHATVTNYTTSVPVQQMLLLISSGPGGFWNMKKNGPDWYTAEIQIRVKASSAPDQPAATTGPNAYDTQRGWVTLSYGGKERLPLTAKVQNGYARWQFRVADGIDAQKRKVFPNWPIGQRLLQTKYDVEITRFTPVAPDSDGARELYLEAVTEQTYQLYSFPMRSLLRIDYDESVGLKREPEVEVQFRGRKCRVVTGFNGKGDPIFDRKWTRNPVWNACELITDGLTGGGIGGHGDETVNWQSAKAAAEFCDEVVKFGGTSGVRAECDYVMVKQKNLFAALTDMLAGSGVSPAFSRGKWFFPVDSDDRAPVTDPLTGKDWTLSDADILDEEDGQPTDGLVFERKSIEQTMTDMHITFPDEEYGFDKDADPVYIPIAEEDIKIRNIRKVDLPAVRRRWQAERIGYKLADDEVNNYRFATIRPNNLRTLALDPGDVFVLDCPSAQIPSGQKAMIVERTPGGSNLRQELRVLLLGKLTAQAIQTGSTQAPVSGGGFAGPNGGVSPGMRQPTDVPQSFILKVETL